MEIESVVGTSVSGSIASTATDDSDSLRSAAPPPPTLPISEKRRCHDIFWLFVFVLHLLAFGFALTLLGMNRFREPDRLNIDRYTNITVFGNQTAEAETSDGSSGVVGRVDLTETFWPLYGLSGGVAVALAAAWLLLLGKWGSLMLKISVHSLTTYLAVISVLCFWGEHFFWGVAFGIGAVLQFFYVMAVLHRFPFTMLVLQKAVKMVKDVPEVIGVSYLFMFVMLCWMVLWSFGVAGTISLAMDSNARWWLLVIFSVSLFWTGAVLCNTVHVIVSGVIFYVLIHDGREDALVPQKTLMKSLRYALTTSFGSICYGSLFTAAIRALRWEIRAIRSKIGSNECLLCCVDFLFHLVEVLVRFFNKYAYVQIAVTGKGFNHSARDAWELFQSTGIETVIAYDCSGAVLLMGTVLSGLITGTCAAIWTHFKRSDKILIVGATSMLMGMIMVGLALVVVESAVTSIYICFAEDPSLIRRWDAAFFNQMSVVLHQRLQYRSAKAQNVLSHRLDQIPDSPPL